MSNSLLMNRTTIDKLADPPVNVALRGAGGHLGRRITSEILRTQNDINLAVCILNDDSTSFSNFRYELEALPQEVIRELVVLIDATHRKVRELVASWNNCPLEIMPLDQGATLLRATDVVIDSASVGDKRNGFISEFYSSFTQIKPVLHQSGTYPAHTTLIPPFEPDLKHDHPHSYRLGDCIMSGFAPLLYPFRELVSKVSTAFVIQRQGRLHDYTTSDNLKDIINHSSIEEQVKSNIAELVPNVPTSEIDVTVFQTPGQDWYMCKCRFHLIEEMSREKILDILRQQSRIKIAPSSVNVSTSQVEQGLRQTYERTHKPLSPIICFNSPGAIQVNGAEVTLRLAFYSKAVAVLPSIDAVRSLARKISVSESMKITDRNIGF